MQKMKKMLAILLTLSMVLSYVPVPALAEESSCDHHEHDEVCGYTAQGVCSYSCELCEQEESACTGQSDCPADEHEDDCAKKLADDQTAAEAAAKLAAEQGVTEASAKAVAEQAVAEESAKAAEDQAAADAVAALIDALPSLEAIQAKPREEQGMYVEQINAAYDAYGKLTEEQMALLSPVEALFKPYFDYFNGQIQETATTHKHPVCGSTCSCGSSHSSVTWSKLPATATTLSSGNYYLDSDTIYSGSAFFEITGNVSICLNGNTLTKCDTTVTIKVKSNGNLTICDCVGGGKITDEAYDGCAGSAIEVNGNAGMTMYGGTVETHNSMGVTSNTTGNLRIHGGSITAPYNGVYLYAVNDFEISGGTLAGDASGLACDGSTVNNITISGGVIQGEEAGFYYCYTDCSGEVLICGGTISGTNTDIYISDTASAASDATISLNGYNGTPLTFGLDSSAAEGSYIAKEVSGDGLVVLTGSSYVASYDAANRAVRLGATAHTHNFNATTHKCSCGKIGGTCGANLIWDFDEIAGTLTISGTGAMTDYTITSAAPWAAYAADIASLVIGSDVTAIGNRAFRDFRNCTSVTLPDTLTDLGEGSFTNMVQLSSITIPSGISEIPAGTFSGCKALSELRIPKGVTSVAFNGLSYCEGLQTLYLPATLKTVESDAIYGCYALKDVFFAGTEEAWKLVSIGSNNTSLTGATIHCNDATGACGSSITWTLYSDGLLKINGTGDISSYSAYDSPFENYRERITRVIIGDGITTIGKNLFYGQFPKLEYVQIPTSVTRIQATAFGASPDNVTKKYLGTMAQWEDIYIAEYVSYGNQYGAQCSDGTILYMGPCGADARFRLLGDGTLQVTGSGSMSFYQYLPNASHWSNDDRILKATISEGILSVDDDAFRACSNLQSVSLPTTLKSIGYNAFMGCAKLEEIQIPSTVTSIGGSAFYNCSSLKEITIPSGVKYLQRDTFYNCDSLTEIVIPETVTMVKESAFRSCSGLQSILFLGNAPTFETYAFNDVETTVYYPGGNETWTTAKMQQYGGTVNWVCADCKDGHTEVVDKGYAATCTEDGLSDGKHCSVCSKVLAAQEVIPGGHTVKNGICTRCSVYGTCGENLIWEYDKTTCNLTITGDGTMADYVYPQYAPWNRYKENIKTVVMEQGVSSIGKSAFEDCTALVDAFIPNSVQSIGSYCFNNCSSLTSIQLPEGITTIPYEAFARTKLGSLRIPETVTTIGRGAFAWCRSMTAIEIPAGVTSIEAEAFRASELKLIRFLGDTPTFGNNVFYQDNLTVLYPSSFSSWEDAKGNYGGTVAWVSYGDSHTVHEFNENNLCSCGAIGGKCGENAWWELDLGSSALIISGTGTMTNYNSNDTPWADYVDSIGKIVVSEGITSLSACGFKYFTILTEVSLPDTLQSIGYECFLYCPALKQISIPENVTTIGSYAFEQCHSLESAVIPQHVTEIGLGVFNQCTSLKSVTIPAAVKTIGTGAFSNCSSLKDVYYGSNERNWNSISISTNNACLLNATIHYTDPCAAGHTEVVDPGIPATCTKPGISEGKHCSVCGEVFVAQEEIPAAGHSFTDGKCTGCGLICGACGENLTWTLDDAGTLTISGTGAMYDYSYSSLEPWYDYRKEIVSVVLPDGITSIGDYAFYYCSNLTSVTIPDGVNSIGIYAFGFCGKITSIMLPDSVTEIGIQAFYYCSGLTSVTLPNSVTSIAQYVFSYCKGLTNITIPVSIKSIGDSAFSGCNNLTDVYYGGAEIQWNELDIGTQNDYLLNATIHYADPCKEGHDFTDGSCSKCRLVGGYCGDPDINGGKNVIWYYGRRTSTITVSGSGAMEDFSKSNAPWYNSYRSNVQAVVIQDGVTSVGSYAFYLCSALKSVTIPSSVTQIGDSAFSYCYKLTDVAIAEGVTTIGESAFRYCENLTNIKIPRSVTSIDRWAFTDCLGLTSIELTSSVTSIGDSAFSYCNKLEDVYYYGTETQWNAVSIGSSNQKLENATIHFIDPCESGHLYGSDHICSNCGAIGGICGDNLNWSLDDGKLTITGSDAMYDFDSEGDVPWAAYRSIITSVILPDGLTRIGEMAFAYCSSMESITFKGNAPTIGETAFVEMKTTVYYPVNNSTWTEVIGENYGGAITWTCESCRNGHTEVIDEGVAATCTEPGLTEGKHCSVCNEVIVAQEVISGGHTVVEHICTRCNAYGTCGENVYWALDESTGKLTIYGTGEVTNWSYEEMPWYVRRDSIKHVSVENGVSRIFSAFKNHSNLVSVELPESMRQIDWQVFSGCTKLERIEIPDSITYIGGYAFENCTSLSSIQIPDSVTEIGNGAFAGCSGLEDVYITDPNAWCKIRFGNFDAVPMNNGGQLHILDSQGSEVVEVVLDNSVVSIPQYAFYNGTNLTSITIPNSVTQIGTGAFRGCKNLQKVNIPNGIDTISAQAFYECSTLKEIGIPENVKIIADHAFNGCSSLAKIVFPSGMSQIGDAAFNGCSNLTEIVFTGKSPIFVGWPGPFSGVKATAYYPPNDASWTDSVKQGYGGSIIWVANNPITISILDTELTVGDPIPESFDFTVPEGVNKEDIKLTFTVKDSEGNVVTDIKTPGEYTITATPVEGENPSYRITVVDGKLTVAESIIPMEIKSSNIVLGNELAMYFYVSNTDLTGEDYVAVVTKTYADGREDVVEEIPYAEWENTSNNRKRFKFNGIAAKEMGDYLVAVIKDNDGTVLSETYTDSIQKYIERGFETGNAQKDAKLATMLVDMLNYGAAAQNMFTYNTAHPANENMGAYQEYATKSVSLNNKQEKGQGFKSMSLVLESNISMLMFFEKAHVTKDMTAVVTFTDHYRKTHEIEVAGSDFEDRGSKGWAIIINELVVADGCQMVTCEFKDANGNKVEGVYGIDSMESMCARAVAGGGGTYYEDIMKFSMAAYSYFH